MIEQILDKRVRKSCQSLFSLPLAYLSIVIIISILFDFWRISTIYSQIESWSEPINISNTSRPSSLPYITDDSLGNVHVIWTEDLDAEVDAVPDTIFYTSLVDGVWSAPVDILAVPFGDRAEPNAMAIDPSGRIVILWSTNSTINLSSVDSDEAHQPQSWITHVVDSGKRFRSSDMFIDSGGVYHLVYVIDESEIVYTSSEDGGASWAPLSQVTLIEDDNFALLSVSMILDQSSIIHTSWTMTAASNNWGPVGVWYARSIDDGANWQAPLEMASGPGYGASNLLVDSLQQIHIAWNGTGGIGGRYHRLSTDNGESWSELVAVVDGTITGMPGPPTLMEDSSRTVHIIFPGRGNERESIWYTCWRNGEWQLVEQISSILPHSERSAATITLGNQIHAIWLEYASGDIWYTSTSTDAPGLQPAIVAHTENETTVQEVTIAAEESHQNLSDEVEQFNPSRLDASDLMEPATTNNARPLLYGLAAAVVLIILVMLIQLARRSYANRSG